MLYFQIKVPYSVFVTCSITLRSAICKKKIWISLEQLLKNHSLIWWEVVGNRYFDKISSCKFPILTELIFSSRFRIFRGSDIAWHSLA